MVWWRSWFDTPGKLVSADRPVFFPHRTIHRGVPLCRGAILSPSAENAKINVTNEPYSCTYILCNYLPFSLAAKGAQGGPQQHKTPKQKHSPTDISKRLRSSQNNMDCIYMTPLHCPFALSIFWWLEPLGNVSGWASMFKSLGPSSTTTGSFWTAGADNCSFLGTLLWPSHLLWHFLHRVLCGRSAETYFPAGMNQGLAALLSMPPVFSFEFLGDTNTYGNCNGWMGQQFRTFS